MFENYLTPSEAAERLGIAPTYLNYLRSADAAKRGFSGPEYTMEFGRIIYHVSHLDQWNRDRLAKKSKGSN